MARHIIFCSDRFDLFDRFTPNGQSGQFGHVIFFATSATFAMSNFFLCRTRRWLFLYILSHLLSITELLPTHLGSMSVQLPPNLKNRKLLRDEKGRFRVVYRLVSVSYVSRTPVVSLSCLPES